MALWRIDRCKAEAGYRSNTSIHKLIREGLWPKAVPIGQRSVGWPDYEIEAICLARIAGQKDDDIKELVNRLHLKRSELYAQF